jgi:putative lipoprotein
LVLLFTLHVGREPTSTDPWFSRDKAKHFFMSAFIQSASFSALRATGAHKGASLVGATAVSLSIGVGKELYDRRFGGDPSFKDLTWDAAGIAAASLLLRRTEP